MDFFFEDMSCMPSSHDDSQKVTSHHMTLDTEESQHMSGDMDSSKGKSSNKSMPESQEQHTSSIDDVSRRLQELVEKINDRRTTDQKVLDSYQQKLVEKVTEMCQQMKEHLYMIYEENSNEMHVKLQELTRVLGNCTKLNSELVEARQALASFRV